MGGSFTGLPLMIMSAIKDGRLPVMLDKERHLLFSLNVIDELQDRFGSFDHLDEVLQGKDAIKNLKWLLTLLLNEGAEEDEAPLTVKEVGKLMHMGNFDNIKTAIFKSFAVGNTGTDTHPEVYDEEDNGKEKKNTAAGKD